MNSAPIQLLPNEYGSENQKKVSEKVAPEETGKRFDDVLKSAVEKNEPEKVSRKKEARNSDDGGKEPASSGKDAEKAEAAVEPRAEKKHKPDDADGKISRKNKNLKEEAAAENPEAGQELSAFFAAEGGKIIGKEAESSFGKKEQREAGVKGRILKFDPSRAAASAEMSSAAGESASSVLQPKVKIRTGAEKVSSASEGRKGGEDLFAEKPGAEKGALKKAGKSGKAEASFMSAAAELAGGGKTDDKAGKAKSRRKDPASARIKFADHRAASVSEGLKAGQSAETAETAELKGRAGIDDAGKTIELNASADPARADERMGQPRSIQSTVLSQLRDGVNQQIVKQAGIVVKSDGSGEIKLIMKPEQLGKVRIQLSLNDNHIAGRIIVENNIVREIFESNLENLYKAFGSEGFENGGLEVSVQGGNTGDSGKRSQSGSGKRAVQTIEDAVPEVVDSEWRNNAVNMVV